MIEDKNVLTYHSLYFKLPRGVFMAKTDMIILFLISSMFSVFIIRGAIKTMLKANIGKKNEKKVNPKPTVIGRISLVYTIKYTKKYSKLCKIMVLINCIYISLVVLFFSLMVLSVFNTLFQQISSIILIIKGLVLDIPAILFSIFATKHGKHGGVVWRFEE